MASLRSPNKATPKFYCHEVIFLKIWKGREITLQKAALHQCELSQINMVDKWGNML